MTFTLSQNIDPNKIFLVNRSELDGRIDAIYISQKIKIRKQFNYPTIKLSKLVKSLSGGTPSKGNPDYWDGPIYWVSPKDFKQFYLDKSEDTITELGLKDSSTRLISEKSVLIVVRSGVLIHTLPVAINTIPVTINQDIKALIPTNKILPEYLGYYFNIFNDELLPLIVKHGTTVQSVNTYEFNRLEVPVPNAIKEQQIIINILDKAYSKKQQKESEAKYYIESIDNYLLEELGITLPKLDSSLQNRIFISNFREVVGNRFDSIYYKTRNYRVEGGIFKNKRLKQIANLVKGQSITKEKIQEGKFPVIAGGQSSPYHHAEYNHNANVITVSASGAYAGYVWYHDYPIFASDCTVIKSKDEKTITTYFLSELLKLKQKEIYFMQQGAGQPHVYASDLGQLLIPIPNPEKQIEIVNHIKEIRSRANDLQEEAIQVLENAKKQVKRMIIGE